MEPDVLVVGAGPVGLTMAAELARFGVPVRIVDRNAGRTDKSKALVLWSRSLELIDRMGCGAAFVGAGVKVTAANMRTAGRVIAHIPLDTVTTPHPYALMLPQSETERLMEQHLNALGVQVERQVEMTRFAGGADDVTVTLRQAGGGEETVRPKWLIGCDGAHSVVRHSLGMAFEGDTLPSEWILADVHLAGAAFSPTELDLFWHADGTLALFPIGLGRYRVIADVGEAHDGAPRSEPTLDDVQQILDRRGPGGITAMDPVWMSGFGINERKVADYRVGRVFLAGDAAHVHSPAGGQGMNTGIQDACNLAWKLALVSRGLAAPEPMLGSYSTERSPVARQVLADTGRLTSLAVLKGGVAQAIRNTLASLLFGLSPVRRAVNTALSELSVGYPDSPLNERRGHAWGGPAAGERAPVREADQPVGAGGTPRFAVFVAPGEGWAQLAARYPDLLEPSVRPPFEEGGAWLVRPDGYVAMATAGDAVDDVAAHLDRIIGAD
jgi:2-polyprenyl-6-methoxyphenol hydroxylase-like FAD-dependent oxidoreductase